MFDSWVREDPLEKEMAKHSNILAWKIPWTEEPEGLQSMGLKIVGFSTNARTCLWASDFTLLGLSFPVG